MKFSQSLILSIPTNGPAANARVDLFVEHGDRDGAASAHMRLAAVVKAAVAQWLVDESKVVELGERQSSSSLAMAAVSYLSDEEVAFMRRTYPNLTVAAAPTWESETLRLADEAGADGDDDDDEVGE